MQNNEVLISPSILASDFSRPISALKEIENSGCDYVHLDVMDGIFVPQITFGAKFIKDLRKESDLVFDTHLMITEPEKHISSFIDAGSDIITVHAESTNHLWRCINLIKDSGKMAGVALNPATPISFISPILPIIDYVLIMTVNPGWGGQKFINETLLKVKDLNLEKKNNNYSYIIAVDGGISEENILTVSDFGASLFVMGTAFFKKEDKSLFIDSIKEALTR